MPALLEVEGLVVRYGGVVAVRGIDLEVADGEIVTVLGANGAGKTSMLSAIAGALQAAAGRVVFDGARIDGEPAHRIVRRGMVLVPEGRRILAPLSVEENLLLGAYTRRSRAEISETLERAYGLFPVLRSRRRVPGGLLSGGEQQLLAFGRAMMARPRLILLDEPSMGLAPLMVKAVMSAVGQIAAQGISIVMVEQNAAAALALAGRAYVISQGSVVAHGTAGEVAAMPAVAEAFLGIGAPGQGAGSHAVRSAARHGGR